MHRFRLPIVARRSWDFLRSRLIKVRDVLVPQVALRWLLCFETRTSLTFISLERRKSQDRRATIGSRNRFIQSSESRELQKLRWHPEFTVLRSAKRGKPGPPTPTLFKGSFLIFTC